MRIDLNQLWIEKKPKMKETNENFDQQEKPKEAKIDLRQKLHRQEKRNLSFYM